MPSCSRTAPRCLTWRRPSIPFPASTTSVCFISGRRSGTWCGACSMPKSSTKCCGWRCSGWGRRVPASWKFAGERDRRTPTAKRAARLAYQRSLQRALERRFPDLRCLASTTSIGSGAIVWPDLCPRPAAARTVRLRGAGRECAGDPGFDRCGSDLRHSVARCLPPGASGKDGGRRAETVSARGRFGADPRAHGASASAAPPSGSCTNWKSATTS